MNMGNGEKYISKDTMDKKHIHDYRLDTLGQKEADKYNKKFILYQVLFFIVFVKMGFVVYLLKINDYPSLSILYVIVIFVFILSLLVASIIGSSRKRNRCSECLEKMERYIHPEINYVCHPCKKYLNKNVIKAE